jgi:hypothetical protein
MIKTIFLNLGLILLLLGSGELGLAGREGHGFLPVGFTCTSADVSSQDLRVVLGVNHSEVRSAELKNKSTLPISFACSDRFSDSEITQDLQTTVTCLEIGGAHWRLDLQESLSQTRLLIFEVNHEPEAVLSEILTCY